MTQVPGHAEMLGGRTKWSTNISKPAQDHEGNGEKTQGEMIRQHNKGGTTFAGNDSLFDCFATYKTQYVQLYNKDNGDKEGNKLGGRSDSIATKWRTFVRLLRKDTFQRHLESILEYILQKQLLEKDQRVNLSK